jgi:transcription antitermination factor NusG
MREIAADQIDVNSGLTETPLAMHRPQWYATYTCANHEKRVAAELRARAVENFLPLYPSVRRWKDRRVRLDLPLFPGYVFVRLALCDRIRVVQVPGVVRLVGFGGVPAALPESEVEIVRAGLSRGSRAEPHPFLTVGRRVRIVDGPFAGLQGILKQKKSGLRVVVSLELIQRSVVVDVDAAGIESVTPL